MASNHLNILGSGHTSNIPWIWEKISRELVKMFCGLDTPGPVYHPPVKGEEGIGSRSQQDRQQPMTGSYIIWLSHVQLWSKI